MGEDDEENKCPTGSFQDSKVVEFCQEKFLSPARIWSVLFYSKAMADKSTQSFSKVWRALTDVVPSRNKQAAIGAVDCSKHRKLCQEKGVMKDRLPVARRYESDTSVG